MSAGKPATRTVLLHMEDFKISENLSRFAVKCGMWGYIKQMTPELARFVAARRARGVAPSARDPAAFGAPSNAAGGGDAAAAPPGGIGQRSRSTGMLSRTLSRHRPTLKRVASAVVAGSMLVALGSASARNSEANLRRRGSRLPRGSSDDDDDCALV